jgi:hypothetical protein
MAVLSLASVRLLPETPALAPCILPILDFSTAHAYIKNPPNLSPLPSRIFLSDRLLGRRNRPAREIRWLRINIRNQQ